MPKCQADSYVVCVNEMPIGVGVAGGGGVGTVGVMLVLSCAGESAGDGAKVLVV